MAWLDLQALLVQLLPREESPFELSDITEALRDIYGDLINYDKVSHTFRTSFKNPHLKEKVAPMNPGQAPLLFEPETARRIARQTVHGKMPDELRAARETRKARRAAKISKKSAAKSK